MALVACKACGNPISRNAPACPQCGEPAPKRTSLFTWLIAGLFAYLAFQCATLSTPERPTSPERDAQREKDRKAEAILTDARIDCRFAVRKFLKDPDSATYVDQDTAPVEITKSGAVVTMTVRAKNSFGANVTQRFRCEADLVGDKLHMRKVIAL